MVVVGGGEGEGEGEGPAGRMQPRQHCSGIHAAAQRPNPSRRHGPISSHYCGNTPLNPASPPSH